MTRLSVCIAAGLASFNLMAADVPPSISSQPSSQAAHPGFSITLNATASGTAPLRFQWRFNGAVPDAVALKVMFNPGWAAWLDGCEEIEGGTSAAIKLKEARAAAMQTERRVMPENGRGMEDRTVHL